MIPGLTYQTALMILAISAVASNSILALWVALSRRHWFWRAAALQGVVALLLTIPAPGLAYFVLGHAAVVVLSIAVVRLIRAVRHRIKNRATVVVAKPFWQFSLRDLLLAMVIAGVAAAEITHLAGVRWGAFELGRWIGLLTLCVAVGTLGRRWLKLRFAAVVLVIVVASGLTDAALARSSLFFPFNEEWEDDAKDDFLFRVVGPGELLALFWLLMARYGGVQIAGTGATMATANILPDWEPDSDQSLPTAAQRRNVRFGVPMPGFRRRLARGLVAFTMLAAVGPVFFVYMLFPPAPKVPQPFEDGPNAYPRLMDLAAKFNWSSIPTQDWDTATVAALQSFEAQNRDLIAEMSALVEQPCWVPVSYIDARYFLPADDLQLLRIACRAYLAVARLAFLNDQPWEGQKLLAVDLALGEATGRGGLILHMLVATAIESSAIAGMQKQVGKLDEQQSYELLQRLVRLDAGREPIAIILDRDRLYVQLALGWQARLDQMLRRFCDFPSVPILAYDGIQNRIVAQTRLLVCELAIHAFHCATGHDPSSLEALTPKYLPKIPLDPFNDQPLIYRRTEDGYVLYSVGPNRVDDGGKRVPWSELSDGDLFLNIPEDPIDANADAPADEGAPTDDAAAAGSGEDRGSEM